MRRWLDLDCDVAAVSAHLGAAGLLAPFVAARPGLRVLGSTDGFETAVMTVLGQQVSLAAALAGIGPWTADYLALRLFGDRDAYPADDLVLKRALGVTSGRAAAALQPRCSRAAAALSADRAPLRAYAVTHLWTQAVYG